VRLYRNRYRMLPMYPASLIRGDGEIGHEMRPALRCALGEGLQGLVRLDGGLVVVRRLRVAVLGDPQGHRGGLLTTEACHHRPSEGYRFVG